MTLHLIRVAAGLQSVEDLARRQAFLMNRAGRDVVHILTGIAPRRGPEIEAGGSLYWIVKGAIQARQRVIGVDRLETPVEGKGCRFRLDPEIILTEIRPRRPHQGWRYLKPEDAPADRAALPEGAEDLPPDLAAELRDLGLV